MLLTSSILTVLVVSTISFIAVNLDEFIVLIIFFSKVDHQEYKNIDVVLGQLIGFTLIFTLSLVGALLGSYVPYVWLALLGIVPFLIGAVQFYKVLRFWLSKCKKRIQKNTNTGQQSTENGQQNPSAPQISALHEEQNDSKNNEEKSDTDSSKSNEFLVKTVLRYTARYIRPSIVNVTIVIIADGAEEIGVFIPLIASTPIYELPVIFVVFYILIFIQCYAAYLLVNHKTLGSVISRYSKNIVPFVLMGLGLYILSESILAQYFQ